MSGFGWPEFDEEMLFLSEGESVSFHLPFPQVFEHWLITGLQTYTGSCLKCGNKPDFSTGCSCSRKTTFRQLHILKWERDLSYFLLYLSLRFPPNGTNIYDAVHRIWRFDLLWTKALIYFNILTVFWPHAWHNAFGFSRPAHRGTLPWLWHTPSVATCKWVFTLNAK